MSTVGLTKAKERDLRLVLDGRASLIPQGRINSLTNAGFLDAAENVTPRGHAALAAPRMTRAEYECLCAMEQAEQRRMALWVHEGRWCRPHKRCKEHGWAFAGYLTPAGRTALNNVRAAMGSPDWKEGL